MRVRGSQKTHRDSDCYKKTKYQIMVSHMKSPKTGRVTYLLSKSMPAIYISCTPRKFYIRF